jgi:CheY-like chemotaxis protein
MRPRLGELEQSVTLACIALLPRSRGRECLLSNRAPISAQQVFLKDTNLGSGPDGWEVARPARELQADIPNVQVTAEAASEWPTKGVPNSVLVQKPFLPAQLLSAIATLITVADNNRTS